MSFFEGLISDPGKFYPFLGATVAVSVPLFFNLIKEVYFDLQKRKTERNYIAVQLIFLLDDLAYSCGEVSWDYGYDPSSPEPERHDYKAQIPNPVFDMTSVKGEQKFLQPLMLYRLQNINIEMAKIKGRLRDITNSPSFDYDDLPRYYRSRRKEYALLGLYASNIADELRDEFKIPYRNDWNPRLTINDSLKSMHKQESSFQLKKMQRKAKTVMDRHRKQSAENSINTN